MEFNDTQKITDTINKTKQLIKSILDIPIDTFTIVTHSFPDTDALLSIALLLNFVTDNKMPRIKFVDPDKFIPVPGDNYIAVDLKSAIPNCIGHDHLDITWSSCKLIYEALKEIPDISNKNNFATVIPKLGFIVDYCTRAEQRVLKREERGKGSLVNLLYGLRSQQDLISNELLFKVFYAIFLQYLYNIPLDSSTDLSVSYFVTENDLLSNINKITGFLLENIPIPELESAILNLETNDTEELLQKYVEFRTLSNGVEVAINRSSYNLIRQIFSRYHSDIILFVNKYRRIGVIANAKIHFNLDKLADYLHNKDSRWKYVSTARLISKKVSVEEFESESPEKIVQEILNFIENFYIKDDKFHIKSKRIPIFDKKSSGNSGI